MTRTRLEKIDTDVTGEQAIYHLTKMKVLESYQRFYKIGSSIELLYSDDLNIWKRSNMTLQEFKETTWENVYEQI